MSLYYNRYHNMTNDGKPKPMPFIKLPNKSTDKFIKYEQGVTRFDKLSNQYYGNSLHGWLIMQGNAELGGLEFTIPEGTIIRIPFPFKKSLQDYENAVNRYLKLNG